MVPFQLFLAALLGWLEREQRDVIAFLREENRALKAQLAGRRLRLTDAQRRRGVVWTTAESADGDRGSTKAAGEEQSSRCLDEVPLDGAAIQLRQR